MKKLGLISAIIVSTLLFATACSKKTDNNNSSSLSGTLNIYTWDGMFPADVLSDFEKETGVKVNFTNFDSDEEMLAKLQEANGGSYDLIVADDYILEQVIEQNLAFALDKTKIPNIKNVNKDFTKQYYDTDDTYTIPYGAGVPLIVYDKEAVGFDIKSYNDLWDTRLKDSLAIIGNYRVINGITLKSMRESLNTDDVKKIEEAGKKLLKLAPNIRIISDSNTQDALLSGEVSAAFLYTSQVNTALSANPELSLCYPKEGVGFGITPAFIPKNAPNKEAAHAFLNYILDEKIGAKCFEHTQYFCTFKGSESFIADDLKERLILPSNISDMEIISNLPPAAEDMHTLIWTKFKAECE